jgi:hypothetical protein
MAERAPRSREVRPVSSPVVSPTPYCFRVRRRLWRHPLLVAAGVGVLAVVLAAPPAGAVRPTEPSGITVRVGAGHLDVERVGASPTDFPSDVRDRVVSTVKAYLTAATVQPLRRGAVDETAFGAVADATVLARLNGPDRSTLVDEALPRPVGPLKVRARPLDLTGLADANGQVVLVTAALTVDVDGRSEKGKWRITRTGDLVMAPQSDGSWKVAGYDLAVTRSGKGLRVAKSSSPTTPTTVR